MRFVAPFVALFAALAMAQGRNNVINNGSGGLNVTAGGQLTITWQNPSSSTVTIKLTQGSNIQPSDGLTLDTNVPASAETATVTIPEGSQVDGQQYNIEIIDDTDPTNINFSAPFYIQGATGTGATTTSSSSSTSTSSSSSSSSSSGSSSSMTSSMSGSHTSTSASRTSTASGSSSTSSAPSIGEGSSLKAGPLLAIMVAAVAAF